MGKTLDQLFGEEAQQPAAENKVRPGWESVSADAGAQSLIDHGPAPRAKKAQATGGMVNGRGILTIPFTRQAQQQAAMVAQLPPAKVDVTGVDLMGALRRSLEAAGKPESILDSETTVQKTLLETIEEDAGASPKPPLPGPKPPLPAPPPPLPVPAPLPVTEKPPLPDHPVTYTWEEGVVSPTMVAESLTEDQPFCYVSGPAGTGKTTLARLLLEMGNARAAGRMVLCATTGIAAVNLGNAMTINALLRYFTAKDLMELYETRRLHDRLRLLARAGLETILLDEVSMLSGNVLHCLVEAIEDVNSTASYEKDLYEFQHGEASKISGKLRLILVGDFAQLPPIDAPYAFEGPGWDRFAKNTFTLTKVWRQDDLEFVKALQAVRRGKPLDAIATFRPNFVQAIDLKFDGTTIVSKNAQVDVINSRRHALLEGTPIEWAAVKSGEQHADWQKNIPDAVSVKPGALVMMLMNRPVPRLGGGDDANLSQAYYYVNGDCGHVVEEDKFQAADDDGHPQWIRQGIKVRLLRTGEIVTVVPHAKEWVEPCKPPEVVPADYQAKPGETLTYRKNPDTEKTERVIVKRLKGQITYMPMRLAYATTVHKSQGLSLDKVQVVIADWMFTKPGTMYVALSRARSLQGLRIVGTEQMFMSRCTVDKKIGAFV